MSFFKHKHLLSISRRPSSILLLLLAGLLLAGCQMNMRDDARLKPLEPSTFFEDNRSARPFVENTVSRGNLQLDPELYQGRTAAGEFVAEFPFPITAEVMERGRERYDIYCSPCHGRQGNGQGMIVQRGFKQPSSFHIDRLREAPPGYYYNVITNGFGTMYSYAARVEPEDRWAIIAYIRALQLSQNATITDVPEEQRDDLISGPER